MVRVATCGWVLSSIYDTEVCALFLLLLMAVFIGPSRSAE